ncbi:DUF1080 domain-containing protein [Algoriphagus namhaensis]|uniref:DUF1080 domain-containing protein n=1 Tax=Algoriphagus namhaensis TaxID=915353 RepID=A0ABV8ANJ4_9BACT
MNKIKLLSFASLFLVWSCGTSDKVEDSLEAEVAEVEDAVMDNTLSDDERGEGWMLLFDGESMDGWRAFNGESLPDSWVIEDGAMKALGTGGDIGGDIVFGPMEFEEFELEFTWKIEEGGNSGVMYHVVEDPKYKAPYETGPEYQVIDQLGFPDPLEAWQSIGADYAMYEPDYEGAVKPAGEWNVSRIVFSTEGSSYWLNGKKTVEFMPYSEDWETRKNSGKWDAFPDYAIAKSGLIALQDHGAEAWFKNIKIRKL